MKANTRSPLRLLCCCSGGCSAPPLISLNGGYSHRGRWVSSRPPAHHPHHCASHEPSSLGIVVSRSSGARHSSKPSGKETCCSGTASNLSSDRLAGANGRR